MLGVIAHRGHQVLDPVERFGRRPIALCDLELALARGVAERDPDDEPVEFRLGHLTTERAIAVLRLYNGLSEEETAATLGCSVGAVKSQLNEARRRLADMLTADGLRPSTSRVPSHVPGP